MTEARVALVTGSARGMGRAMAEVLAAAGHRVVGLDRIEQEQGPLERTISADLLDRAVPRQVVDDIVASEGRLDILVHNAAVYVPTHPLPEVTMEDYDLQTGVNLRAVFFLSQAAAEVMKPNGWGRIIGISSVGARTGGVSHSAVYNAAKAGRHQPDEELRPQLRAVRDHRQRRGARCGQGVHDRSPRR